MTVIAFIIDAILVRLMAQQYREEVEEMHRIERAKQREIKRRENARWYIETRARFDRDDLIRAWERLEVGA